jgi:hypothetical protein
MPVAQLVLQSPPRFFAPVRTIFNQNEAPSDLAAIFSAVTVIDAASQLNVRAANAAAAPEHRGDPSQPKFIVCARSDPFLARCNAVNNPHNCFDADFMTARRIDGNATQD